MKDKPYLKKYNLAEPDLGELEKEYLIKAYDSGWISSLGEFVDSFESSFADFTNCEFAVSVSNGTVALHLSLIALGIGSGDEVIVPSLTFVATAASVLHSGATPVFIDSGSKTYNIDVDLIEKAITDKTKAIIAVHLYGQPSNMKEINKIAKKYNLNVIEDAAEAHGAKYHGVPVGSMSDLATFSFYGNKILTTGEGGMITTNNIDLYQKLRFFRDHAMSKEKRYYHTEIGYNYRMTNLQAAIGYGQLSRFDEIIGKKYKIQKIYDDKLSKLSKYIEPMRKIENVLDVPWLVCCVLRPKFSVKRDELLLKLSQLGIDNRPFFIPLHTQPPYKRFKFFSKNPDYSYCESLSSRGFNLPSTNMLDEKDVEYICAKVFDLISS